MPSNKWAILYARVSTPEQAERDLSIPTQLRALRELAHRSGLVVVAEFQDVASGTGFRGRPGLMAALKYASSHDTVDALLVHRVDRLARNTFDYHTIRARLRATGVRIISCVEHFDEGPLGSLLENIMAALSEFYSANLSMEVRKSIEERHAQGLWTNGTPPLGYLLEKRRLVPDPARAPNMRYAFERWATGTLTTTKLAEEMYSRGLVNGRGKRITAKRWCDLLRNPTYTGRLSSGANIVEDTHPALVDPATFAQGLAVFATRREQHASHPVHHVFALRRLVLCPACSRYLIGEEHHRSNSRIYRYYRCHKPRCGINIHAERLEQQVNELLGDHTIDQVVSIGLKDQRPFLRFRDDEYVQKSGLELRPGSSESKNAA